MKANNFFKLLISIVICESAGIIGSVFTAFNIKILSPLDFLEIKTGGTSYSLRESFAWYAGLARPKLSPPNWVFGPVWTTLFVLMGIAAFLVWTRGLERKEVRIALGIFIGQLILNMLWSIIFFGMKNPGGAFIEIIFLWLAIVVTIIAFYKISKPAAWLLIPYILWVSFAVYLNYSIWQLL